MKKNTKNTTTKHNRSESKTKSLSSKSKEKTERYGGKIRFPIKIIREDLRRLFFNINQCPFQNIGLLVSTYNKKLYYGTATLVNSNILITCAHNVYSHQYKKCPDRIQFYPQINGTKYQSQKVLVKKPYIYSEKYEQTQQNVFEQIDLDWAFLVLQKPITAKKQTFQIIVNCPQVDKQIGLYGYPYQKVKDARQKWCLYGQKGLFSLSAPKNGTPQIITYEISSTPGQSGSALILDLKNQKKAIIGVHSQCGKDDQEYNKGSRLTSAKMQLVNQQLLKSFPSQKPLRYRILKLDDFQ